MDRADNLNKTGEMFECIIIKSSELYRPDVIYEWVIHVLGFSKYQNIKKKGFLRALLSHLLFISFVYISIKLPSPEIVIYN